MVRLIATRTVRYRGRIHAAGAVFPASRADALILTRIGHARKATKHERATQSRDRDAKQRAAAPDEGGEGAQEIEASRAEYEFLTGTPADKRWSAKTLREKIAAASADDGDAV